MRTVLLLILHEFRKQGRSRAGLPYAGVLPGGPWDGNTDADSFAFDLARIQETGHQILSESRFPS